VLSLNSFGTTRQVRFVADVLLELDWDHKEKFNSFLEIELSFCNKPDLPGSTKTIERKHISRAPWEREIG
jgi:ferritin-like protein